MEKTVAVVGTGQTNHGKRFDVSWPELVHEAVERALDETNLTMQDVDAIVCGSMPGMLEGTSDPHFWLTDGIGAYGKPVMRIATCGSTGMSVALTAFYHVASGLFDTVLAVGTEKQYEGSSQGVISQMGDPHLIRPFFPGAVAGFATQCVNYVSKYGLKMENVAEAAAMISVKCHSDALDNPYAHIKAKLTVDDVLKSRVICYPMRLWDCSPTSDGACAVVFASTKVAKEIAEEPAWVKGVGYAGDEQFYGDKDMVDWTACKTAVKRAYDMAGVMNPLKDLDVAELYNPFTYQELLWYELFGFCEKGRGIDVARNGVTTRRGDLPCDPSGGNLCTHPIGATGLIRVAEAANQVMGRAGNHQIPDAETALAHAMGGLMQFNGVMILGR
ncbi:MAG: thiolase family protein [Thaumarchaeota archaeon]|nr:thiolase family protein [Nitrososphaerota archaeon]